MRIPRVGISLLYLRAAELLSMSTASIHRRRDAGHLPELSREEIHVAISQLLGDRFDWQIRLAEQTAGGCGATLKQVCVRRHAHRSAEAATKRGLVHAKFFRQTGIIHL